MTEEELFSTPISKSAPIKTEEEIASGQVGYSPLHVLFIHFLEQACGSKNCMARKLKNAEYYCHRCIRALCFARWLALNVFSDFHFESLKDSLVERNKSATQRCCLFSTSCVSEYPEKEPVTKYNLFERYGKWIVS